jgi:uncharacterized protein
MAVRRVKCPTCHREIDWSQSPYHPFCSERCRLIDLGAWLTEKHAIPGEPAPEQTTPESAAEQTEAPPRRHS